MLNVYFLTEWLCIAMLAVTAGLVVTLRAETASDPGAGTALRVTAAVLPLGVTYTKSVRDKWKLLERAMQQLSYGGSILLLLDQHVCCLGLWPSERQASTKVSVPHPPELRSRQMVRNWRWLLLILHYMESNMSS